MSAALPRPPSASAGLADWLDYQERLHPRSIELGLARVGAVADRLGLRAAHVPTLTVAGTNGKGSSATLASLALREAGYRTGLYTSPHLLRYHERIAVDGREAGDDELCAAFADIERHRGDTPLTYFEFGTLAALWLFREHAVQARVLEVGLGGRLDAVNLIDADVALLTSVGLDHLDWLGPDREAIASEKVHVFRPHRPAVCADPDPPRAVARHAQAIGADLWQIGRDFDAHDEGAAWSWRGRDAQWGALPRPGLPGAAQLRNAAGVIAALRVLAPHCVVDERAVRAALPRLSLRGRFERRGRCIFDVAHNAEAAQALHQQLAARMDARPVHLVLGMLQDKPVEAFCRELAPQVRRVYCATLPPPRGWPAADLAGRVRAAGLPAEAFDDVPGALDAALRNAQDEDEIVVTGSFLTVAAGLAHG